MLGLGSGFRLTFNLVLFYSGTLILSQNTFPDTLPEVVNERRKIEKTLIDTCDRLSSQVEKIDTEC